MIFTKAFFSYEWRNKIDFRREWFYEMCKAWEVYSRICLNLVLMTPIITISFPGHILLHPWLFPPPRGFVRIPHRICAEGWSVFPPMAVLLFPALPNSSTNDRALSLQKESHALPKSINFCGCLILDYLSNIIWYQIVSMKYFLSNIFYARRLSWVE